MIRKSIQLAIIGIFLFGLLGTTAMRLYAQETDLYYLSGRGKDDTVLWDFYSTQGRNSGQWTKISVPSNWELQGFGSYHYGLNEPFDSLRDEKGIYKRSFSVPGGWQGKRIFLVFEGAMTDTKVEINGKSAGPKHRGGFYPFKYDITRLLNFESENTIKATVSKISSDSTVNKAERRADYWVFGGIYRPVYLEAIPKKHINRVAINAEADGHFMLKAFLENVDEGDQIVGRIVSKDGKRKGEAFSNRLDKNQKEVTLNYQLNQPELWSPEDPNLYDVHIRLMSQGKVIHERTQSFGFRTIAVKPDLGLFLNGERILLKGICRHSFWPNSGLTTSKEVSIQDVNLLKDMNMNAVRVAHSPPDKHFLQVCDSLGIMVLDELAGWHDAYGTKLGKRLLKDFVTRDVNHPSVILWDNGNEEGWNTDLDDEFAKYDPQQRVVLHPGDYLNPDSTFNGIYNQHYEGYEEVKEKLEKGSLFFPTEFLHGLYDGGGAAGLADYWSLFRKSPFGGGGFLWALADEGVVRADQHNRIDVHGNNAPDGVVGPYREKEGSYYTIKKIWSPVQIQEPDFQKTFDGVLSIENRFHFTNLNECNFAWQLVDFPKPDQHLQGYRVAQKGEFTGPDVSPGQKGNLQLNLPETWMDHDALFMTAKDPHGRKIYTWTWMISSPNKVRKSIVDHNRQNKARVVEDRDAFILKDGKITVTISKKNGEITGITHEGQPVLFKNGPRLVGDSTALSSIRSYKSGEGPVVEATYEKDKKWVHYTMKNSGWLKIDYKYLPDAGTYKYLGITFDYPPQQIEAVKWLGRGPYRVWKNRMSGMSFNVWSNRYNDTRTGFDWDYPEFKGYFSNMYWAQINTTEEPITVVSGTKGLFLRLLTPEYGPNPRYTKASFPAGDISFLNVINPIGTKVHEPEELGPASQLFEVKSDTKLFEGTLYLYFGVF